MCMHMCVMQDMLCLEPAAAGSGAVTLAPAGVWEASQSISYR